MIHEATGKFSSRSVLPDRNSLAEGIEDWLTIVWTERLFCRRKGAPDKPSRPPYRGIRRQNQSCLSAPLADYWLWVFRTWSHSAEILDRFSFKQAKMVKSPWSMTGRQNFCTSRVQAF